MTDLRRSLARLALALLAAGTLIAFAGCGPKAEEAVPSNNTPTSGDKTLGTPTTGGGGAGGEGAKPGSAPLSKQ